MSPPSTWRRSCSSRSRAKEASFPLLRRSSQGCAPSATGTASCSSRTRCRPGSAVRRACSRWSTSRCSADLITVAKSIASGLPLSGVIGRAEIMDSGHLGAVGGTFIGNPVALAAALAVLDVFEEERIVERAGVVGATIRDRMLAWQQRHPQIGDVRGLGAMLAIELVHDPATKEPAPELAEAVIDAALQRGLILLKAGVPRQLHSRPVPAHDLRRRARRGARRVGRGAGLGSLIQPRYWEGLAKHRQRATFRQTLLAARRKRSEGVRFAAAGLAFASSTPSRPAAGGARFAPARASPAARAAPRTRSRSPRTAACRSSWR